MDKIYNIFKNYLEDIKNNKLEKDYNEIKTTNKNNADELQQIFKKYVTEDPKILNKYTMYQIGGTKEDEYVTKINELDQLIQQSSQLDNTQDLEKKKKDIIQKITDLTGKLEQLKLDIDSKKSDVKKIVSSSRLPQYLQTVDMQIKEMTDGLEINTDLKATDIPIITQIPGIDSYKTFEAMKRQIERNKNIIQQLQDPEQEVKIKELTEKIREQMQKIEQASSKIEEVNTKLKEKISEFTKSLEVNITQLKTIDLQDKNKRESVNYIGVDTSRIINNIFVDPSTTINKVSTIINLAKVGDFDLRDLYTLDVDNINVTNIQIGGTMQDLENTFGQYSIKINEYKNKYNEYTKLLNTYNLCLIKNVLHTLYLTTIMQNKLYVSNYVIYKFIGRGTIRFYKRIIDNIYEEIQKGNISNPIITELRKRYFVTIYVLKSFLSELSKILQSTERIVIDGCDENMQQYFLLLNHFKDILDKYNLKFQNKITIYGRINDIYKEKQDSNDFIKNKKVFISDRERKQIYRDQDIQFIEQINTNLKTNIEAKKTSLLTAKMSDDKKYELREELDNKLEQLDRTKVKDIERIQNPDEDDKIMWVRANESCKQMKCNTSCEHQVLTSYKLSEIFDSTEFTNNADISKYMGLETRLGTGNSTCIITYGYSGTGKTYTLFGKSQSKIQGLLQATLDNLNGLEELYFRTYEIYGRGFTYSDYWTKSEIDNYVYTYKLKIEEMKLKVDKVEELKQDKINDFINKVNASSNKKEEGNYINIKGSDKISSVFANFSDLVDEIDIKRKDGDGSSEESGKQPRIRETPNNKESSRSIIIYDFIIKLSGNPKEIYFVIIDLPGREEIAQTFVSGYMDNEHIINALESQYDRITETEKKITQNKETYLSELRLLLLSITINPIMMSIFATEEIKQFCKNNSEELNKFIEDNEIYDITYTKKQLKGSVGGTSSDLKVGKYSTNQLGSLFKNRKIESLSVNDMTTKYTNDVSYITTIYGSNMLANDNKQIYAILFMYLIKKLCEQNRFDILNIMIEYIIKIKMNNLLEKYIDNIKDIIILKKFIQNLQESNFKSLIMKDIIDKDITDLDELKKTLKRKVKYDFYTTGYEGIYINENIMGIIKYLASNGLRDKNGNTYTDEDIRNKLNIKDQDISKLNIGRQLAISRILSHSNNTVTNDNDPSNPDNCEDQQTSTPTQSASQTQSLIPWKQQLLERKQKQAHAKKIETLSRKTTAMEYTDSVQQITIECKDIPKQLFYVDTLPEDVPEKINTKEYKYNQDNLKNTFELVNNDYKSDKMFRFSNPIISNILGPYLGQNKIETFLLFYLFGNDDDDLRELKCKNQYLLLESTRSFIDAINPE
jgi:hypothetical protein